MGKGVHVLPEESVMNGKDDLLSNCFLTWTSILEEKELNNKSEIDQKSEKK